MTEIILPVSDASRARTLLTYLWQIHDAGGISMGRSHESVLLEAAMELLGPTDLIEMDLDKGDTVNETRSYLSQKKGASMGLKFDDDT